MKKKIDYSIIWKYLNDNLTEQEESELRDWLTSGEKHQEYFDKAVLNAQNNINKEIRVDSRDSWNRLKIGKRKDRLPFKRISIAASILIVFTLSGYFVWNNLVKKEDLLLSEDISYAPGVKKATLIFDNGKKLNLETNTDTIIESREAVIENRDNRLNYHPDERKIKKLKYNQLIVPRGAEYFVVLSDSTKVWVNSETILRYPVPFGKQGRDVYLVGEAFFEVKKDNTRPFVVHSGGHMVKVYGTSFNISSYRSDDKIVTTLVEGLVKVSSEEKTEGYVLKPGFQSIYEKQTAMITEREVDINQYIAWKDGRFIFKEMRLEEIMIILSRWYDVEIIFMDKKLKEIKFTGKLKRYDNIKSVLDKLTKTNELKFTAYGKKIFVN